MAVGGGEEVQSDAVEPVVALLVWGQPTGAHVGQQTGAEEADGLLERAVAVGLGAWPARREPGRARSAAGRQPGGNPGAGSGARRR